MRSLIIIISIVVFYAGMGYSQDLPVAWLGFDELADEITIEKISKSECTIHGNFKIVDGVVGKALRSDGFTTSINCGSDRAQWISTDFSLDAWIALRAYPWNDCAIVNQEKDHKSGYLFGVNGEGILILQYAAGNKWHECTSPEPLPLYDWIHVAATATRLGGMVLYINGEKVAEKPVPVEIVPPNSRFQQGVDMLIARNTTDLPPYPEVRTVYAENASYSFDGYLDEIRLFNYSLPVEEIRAYYMETAPDQRRILEPVRLPSGSAGNNRFGAYYVKLEYMEQWDDLWRGDGSDIVVAFDDVPERIVFWKGISYAPCFVTDKGNWLCHEFMERSARDAGLVGCLESMSDKQARFSHVRIIENTPARVVIHWRNSPVDKYYRQPYPEPLTGWGDWSDEYYTIYPDGVAVRKITMWSSNIAKKGEKGGWYEWAQTLPLMHAGQSPEDIYDWERIMSVANLNGDEQVIAGPDRKIELIENACIQVNYLKSEHNPFLVLWPGGAKIAQYYQEQSGYSRYPWWNHWPVAQIPSGGRYATAPDRPSHSCTSTQDCDEYASTENSVTKIMLCGFTGKDAGGLIPLAKSWGHAPELIVEGKAFSSSGYEASERCYILECSDPGKNDILSLKINAGKDSPMINPAFVINNYGKNEIGLKIDGKDIPHGMDFRVGYRDNLDGTTDAIIWIKETSYKPTDITIIKI